MGPLGVIPRSFRVDGNYEWVVIERNNGAFPNWEPTLNQFALSTRCEILLKRDIILPRVGPFSPPFGAIRLGSYPEFKLQHPDVTSRVSRIVHPPHETKCHCTRFRHQPARRNPETDTPPKTFRFHTKFHSKSEDFPFCDQMPLGVRFKRHCAR